MTTLTAERTSQADQYLDLQHQHHARLGVLLFTAFDYDHRSGRISTQIRNIQQIVCSATRFADIEDFVKNQMGKTGSVAQKWQGIGDKILEQLRQLREESSRMASAPDEQLVLRLKLARGWVRAVVSEYLYRIALDQMEHRHA